MMKFYFCFLNLMNRNRFIDNSIRGQKEKIGITLNQFLPFGTSADFLFVEHQELERRLQQLRSGVQVGQHQVMNRCLNSHLAYQTLFA